MPLIAGPPSHQRAWRRIDHAGDRPIGRTLAKSLEHVEHRFESMFRCSDSCAHLLTLGKLTEGGISAVNFAGFPAQRGYGNPLPKSKRPP